MSRRNTGLALVALLVLVVGILTCSLGQVLGARLSPTVLPTRTPRPTFTRPAAAVVFASPTLDPTRFPEARPPVAQPVALTTPQLVVPGQQQPLVVPAGSGQGGVVTVVVVIVTATPVPTAATTPLAPPAGRSLPGTPGFGAPTQAPSAPTAPAATPTITNTPPPPVIVHVTQDQVFVRQGPGTSYVMVTRLDKDTAITVVGRNRAGDWWKVCCVNGGDVWVADAVVSVEGPLWTVPEVTNIPPTPVPTFTPAPPPTIGPTPTFAWDFRLKGLPAAYPHGENIFMIGAIIGNSSNVPLYGYKLRIRKLSTGQEWLTAGSDAFFTTEPTEWRDYPTPPAGVPRNIKWDSMSVGGVPMGDDVWEITACDGGGTPMSAPVRINTSVAAPKWYYLVFNGK